MAFASDKLYNGYLRRKMPTIVSKVKVKEVMVYLPCLTAHDRENIEAKRETYGNFDAMVLLLDCLKRRENWPEQFIEALEACEHQTIAAEIRAEYDTLRGVNNSSPGSPSNNVTRAHVHPAPPASHLSGPESGGVAAVPSAGVSAPPEPAAQISPPPLEVPVLPPSSSEQQPSLPEAVSQHKPVPEPPQPSQTKVAAPPSTPPPSPETPLTPADRPLKQEEATAHQEPEENSEPCIMDDSVEENLMPEVTSPNVGLVETDFALHPDPLKTTLTTEIRQSEGAPQVHSDVTDGSSFPTLTPEKPPVQDTTPPVDKLPAAVLQPKITAEPPTTQCIESSMEIGTAATASPLPDDDGMDTLCLSKPDVLVSVPPLNHNSPTVPAHSPPVEPYSGDSARMEISDPALESFSSSSTTHGTDSERPYNLESTWESLETMDVQENVVYVAKEASILDGDGPSSAQVKIIKSEADKTVTPSPPSPIITITAVTESGLNAPPGDSCPFSEPASSVNEPKPQTPKEKERHVSRSNIRYTVAAAGVAALALVMAWKFKKGIFLKG